MVRDSLFATTRSRRPRSVVRAERRRSRRRSSGIDHGASSHCRDLLELRRPVHGFGRDEADDGMRRRGEPVRQRAAPRVARRGAQASDRPVRHARRHVPKRAASSCVGATRCRGRGERSRATTERRCRCDRRARRSTRRVGDGRARSRREIASTASAMFVRQLHGLGRRLVDQVVEIGLRETSMQQASSNAPLVAHARRVRPRHCARGARSRRRGSRSHRSRWRTCRCAAASPTFAASASGRDSASLVRHPRRVGRW